MLIFVIVYRIYFKDTNLKKRNPNPGTNVQPNKDLPIHSATETPDYNPPPYTEKLSDLQIIGGFLFTKYEDFYKTHFKAFSGVFSGAGVCR